MSLKKDFGDNEGIIELNPLGPAGPLPLVKGEKIFGQQPEATPAKQVENLVMSEFLESILDKSGKENISRMKGQHA